MKKFFCAEESAKQSGRCGNFDNKNIHGEKISETRYMSIEEAKHLTLEKVKNIYRQKGLI